MSLLLQESGTRRPATDGMVFIPGGTFRMGSDRHYPEEAPVHRVTVGGFWMDRPRATPSRSKRHRATSDFAAFAANRVPAGTRVVVLHN